MSGPKRIKAPKPPKTYKWSGPERRFAMFWNTDIKDLPFEREIRLIKGRDFRFDFVWIELKVALEIDGGIWTVGGHTSGAGKSRDCEKDWLACLEGWQVIRWTPDMITFENIRKLADKLSRKKILQGTGNGVKCEK